MLKLFLFPTLLLALVSCAQETPPIDCETVLDKEPVFMRVPAMQLKDSIQTDLDILSDCGQLDSIDETLLNGMLGVIAVRLMQEDKKITYYTLLAEIGKFKQTEEYRSVRKQIVEGTFNDSKEVKSSAAKLEFTPLEDLPSALLAAKKANKKCLIYFSGYAAVNCRRLEDQILIDPEIQSLIEENCVCFIAYVDDKTVGKKHAQLQKETFKSISQPSFYLLNADGKKLSEIENIPDANAFIAFLKKRMD